MSNSTEGLRWRRREWLSQVEYWINEQLGEFGIGLTGVIDQFHIYPWSTAMRLATDQGTCYFKAVTLALAHEAAVTQALWRRKPDFLPSVLAVDRERGWLLTKDAGSCLEEALNIGSDSGTFEWAVKSYGSLQREVASDSSALLELGIPDRRLTKLPLLYEEILSDSKIASLGQSWGLSREEVRQLRARASELEAVCSILANMDTTESIDHGDFQLRHFFISKGQIRLLDWGDCSLTHPFISFRAMYEGLKHRQDIARDSAWAARLRDSYLNSWQGRLPQEELLYAFDLAQYVSWIVAVLSWRLALSGQPEEFISQYRPSMVRTLRRFLGTSSNI